ncbi:MAG: hypothetical protein Q8R88_09895 [Desulfoprunum sp.]|nr:hypothetical protein [Desulfoprunum sp.]
MIGLSILAALFVYGWISFGVVWWVVKWAKKRGRGPVRWGIVAGLVMYHLVFWDFLPTLIVYKYYCATKAGFWVYKTPEQWKAENPGVAETLTWRKMSPDYQASGVKYGFRLNERIVWINKVTESSFVPVGCSEDLIVDLKNNETLIRRTAIGSGRTGTEITRFWTHFGPCYQDSKGFFGKYETAFKKLGKEIK